MTAPCCSVGARADAAEIDAALRAGEGLGTLAKRFGVAKPTLGRHRLKCLGIRGAETATETGGETAAPKQVEEAKAPSRQQAPSKRKETPKPSEGRTRAIKSRAREETAGETPSETPHETGAETEGGDNDPDWPRCPKTKEGKVLAVIDLMSSDRWERGKTAPLLAEHWGLAQSTVEGIAAEASRRIKSMIDPDEVKRSLCVALSKGVREAVKSKDVRGLSAVAKTYAEVSGALAPKKHELTGRDGAPLGLPPILAALNPPPTVEELEVFAQTGQLPERGVGAPN